LGLRILALILALLPLAATAEQPVRIGVLAFRDLATTHRTWAPTAAQLEQAIPDRSFQVVPMHHEDLDRAVASRSIDFILTQPEQYVIQRTRHGLAALATLMPLAEGRPVSEFGGVIVARQDRQDIQGLDDIRGKRVAAVYEHSLGAYRMQQAVLAKAGINLPGDVASVKFTEQPQDKVIREVLDGRADVGFVRTGLLESMAREGRLDLARLKVVNAQTPADFPLRLSTELYPEWPFAALRGVPTDLAKAVTLALLNITPDSPAARAGSYHGFAPPGDYSSLEAMLSQLKAHPAHRLEFDVEDIAAKYSVQLGAIVVLLMLLTASVVRRLSRDNRRIKKAARDQELLLGSLGEGVCGFDRRGRCTFVNPAAAAITGYGAEEMVGRDGLGQFPLVDINDNSGRDIRRPLVQTLADGVRREGETQLRHRDGRYLHIRYAIAPVREGQRVVGVVLVFQDTTERRQADADLRIAAVAFETQEGMIITDPSARILRVNHAFTEVTGYAPEEVLGQTPAVLQSGRHGPDFYRDMWASLTRDGHWQGEIWNRRKDGEIYPEWLNITAVKHADGSVGHYVGSFLDIGERKQAEEKIEYMALYDLVTGLPNRRLLLERLDRALISRSRADRHGALLFIDLDNFKTLNDTMGHDMGDRLLQQVAQRLSTSVREGDTVARLGGDEFVVMIEDLEDRREEAAAQAELVGEKILACLNQPYRLGDVDHHSGASVGLVLFHNHDHGVDELLKRADMAMYQAKAAGRNTLRFFDPAMQTAVEERAALEKEFRRGLERREFLLHYQPQVDRTGQVLGAEALVRWAHPVRGLTPPGIFIPLAEASGLILPLGQQVLEMACRQLADWQRDPRTAHLTLSVNVSARQFRQGDFVERIVRVLALTGASAHGLKLELTESLMLEGVENVIDKMLALKTLGLGFSLDDFGTGYSSLAYLKRLPLDQIKIDQSFIRDALQDGNDATITRTVLALGQTFGLSVVAEGVETEAQRQFLIDHGCEAFQGYLFSRPRPAEDLDLARTPT
jgi:diguanylate cyclase (GGDEF)-like protein/PAS domain S-box-containing protein